MKEYASNRELLMIICKYDENEKEKNEWDDSSKVPPHHTLLHWDGLSMSKCQRSEAAEGGLVLFSVNDSYAL
jgi:hypothetical protein